MDTIRSHLSLYVGPLLVFGGVILIALVALNPILDLIDQLIEPLLDPLSEIGISEPVLQTMLVAAILALSIYITLYGGMFSLANAGFMGVGAYIGALMTKQFETSLALSLIGGMCAAGMVALLIGLPVLRLRNIYLAIATIGFGEIVVVFFNSIDRFLLDLYKENDMLRPLIGDLYEWLNVEVRTTSSGIPTKAQITGGASGLKNIPTNTETAHLVLFLIIVCYVMYRLHRSRFGRALAAIRQDERVAASQGINVVYYKNAAFFIGALIAGIAGVFDAHRDTLIEPKDYGFDTAVDILAYAVLGGTVNWIGPVLGGLTLRGLPELLRELREYSGVMTGLILLLTIVYLPGGLASLLRLDFWRAGGRFQMAQRLALAGITILLIVNVLPYQQYDNIDGRILGNEFLRRHADMAPLLIIILGLIVLAVRAYVTVPLYSRIPPEEWQVPLMSIGVLLIVSLFATDLLYLALGNLLPGIALFWVVHNVRRAEGGRFAPELAAIAAVAFAAWLLVGLTGLVEDVMLGYYVHLLGTALLIGACLLPYPPTE